MNGLLLAGLIAVAGGLGSALRYLLSTAVNERIPAHVATSSGNSANNRKPARTLPAAGTWAVNTIGSLALGIATGAAAQHIGADRFAVFAIGLCGGFTTFSTAALDVSQLSANNRRVAAVATALGMLVVCVLLAGAGIWLGAKL